MVAKRSEKSPRHPLRGAHQEPRRPVGAIERVQCRRHLAAAVCHTRTSLASNCVSAIRSPERVAATNADMSSICFASISLERSGRGVAPDSRGART